ncbi:MAG TPA: carboxypeptidase-like regulatory domain-containing protein [Candidatus Bathyarchaeia archaeon]|nr:carboxypeptidase-like regulatory domain-containing protein [Candidatus Bathyarchaeia archaeon]
MKKKAVTTPLLIALSMMLVFMPLYTVSGQVGVSITTIAPSQSGKAGDTVRIFGLINTANGAYEIWFGNNLVVTNTSIGYDVDSSFAVPELPEGDYTITLVDVSINVNGTHAFTILPGYSVKALVPSPPAQLQEGSNVVLNVTFTGGQSNTTYYANITVRLPAPLNTNYSRLIELSLTQTGTAQVQLTYPDAAFEPSGSLTNFTGLYRVYFNLTQQLAEDQFFVGFTDTNTYHRGQSVAMRAVGYQANVNSTITITYAKTGANVHSEVVNASSEGIINAAWTVPSDALIGDYNITITPQNTPKLIVDSQLFTVPGYAVKIRTLNLAGDVAPQILVEALDQATNTLYNGTSGVDGIATVNLERGNHTISAFWNNVKVGEINASITEESAFDLPCRLTNLKITVQDKNGLLIPFVSLDITYQYVTTKENASKTGHASGQTDLSGTFSFNSTLPGIGYTINASIYSVVFNINNNTVSDVPAQPTFQVTILCPSRTLTLTIVDYNLAAIPNARIELVEQTSGIFYGAVTDNAGTVSVEITFGKYRLRAYTDNILLNETVIEVFSDTQSEIRCIIYDLQVSVLIVDYFGQPIPNVNVMLHGADQATRSATTQTDGTAKFGNLIGGNVQIIAYLAGREDSYEAVNLQVEAPTTRTIKMGKYVLLGPFLIETSVLATLIVILAAVILFLSMEVYTRKRFKLSKSES